MTLSSAKSAALVAAFLTSGLMGLTAQPPAPPMSPGDTAVKAAPEAVAAGAAVVKGAEDLATKPAATGKKPLEFETTSINYGKVQRGQKVPVAFKVKNVSDRVVEIARVQPGCGCTAAGDNPTSIKPGESSEIKVTFDSTGRQGTQTKSLTVFTKDPDQPEITLTFTGTIMVDIALSTTSVDFGMVDESKGATQSFNLTSTLPAPLKITKVESADARLTVKHLITESMDVSGTPSQVATFSVEVPAGFPDPEFASNITIETDAQPPAENRFFVIARGRVVGDISMAPARIFAVMGLNEKSEREVTLESRSQTAFEILESKLTPDNMGAKVAIKPGNTPHQKIVHVEIAPSTAPTTMRGSVDLTIKRGEKTSRMSLPLIAVARQQGIVNPPPAAQPSAPAANVPKAQAAPVVPPPVDGK